jgi:simple sugar transport system ATP-binding protein
MVPDFFAQDNAILGRHDRAPYRRGLLLDAGAIRGGCEKKMAEWDVRPPTPGLELGFFSGGNQQKLVLAREVEGEPKVLLIGQPTRGVDIGAIEAIHRRLVGLRDAGKAILLVSVELEEILALSDRILVMNAGVISGELTPAEATEERLGLLMAGLNRSS